MITAKDLFEQHRGMDAFARDTKFYVVYRDVDGNTTTISNDDIGKEKPKVEKPKYDKTFYEALSALHSDKNSLYIEAEISKKRISLAPNGLYTVAPGITSSIFDTYYGGSNTHCINEKEMGGKWFVKYKPSDSPFDFDDINFEPPQRNRDEKGRFIKKDC